MYGLYHSLGIVDCLDARIWGGWWRRQRLATNGPVKGQRRVKHRRPLRQAFPSIMEKAKGFPLAFSEDVLGGGQGGINLYIKGHNSHKGMKFVDMVVAGTYNVIV